MTEKTESIVSGAVINELELREALAHPRTHGLTFVNCVFEGLDLTGASFWSCIRGQANLIGCRFEEVNLADASFTGCNLNGCEFINCDLTQTNFEGACLAYAEVCDSDFTKAIGLPVLHDAPMRLFRVASHILEDPTRLNMDSWAESMTGCGSAMCIQGHAVSHAGPLARMLTATMGNEVAGLMLLGPEALLHFYDDDELALEFLQSVVDKGQPRFRSELVWP